MRIGMLTGGGDCPGLNPAIRGFVMRGSDYGFEHIGFRDGWKGLIRGISQPLTVDDVKYTIAEGGTMLGTSRTNPFATKKTDELTKAIANFKRDGVEPILAIVGEDLRNLLDNVKRFELDAIVAIGGEDTLGVASKLFKLGVPTVGVPKTMDNDLDYTDFTFGFDSAVSVATESIDRLRDTARSHSRVMVVEVMGRHAGWVALYAGIAGGADWILLPEIGLNIDEMCTHLVKIRERGRNYSVVVASEGIDVPHPDQADVTVDAFGHVILREHGVAEFVAKTIEQRTGIETRFAVLGHIQRGGPPSVFDRVLASRLGIKAADLVHNGDFGKMASMQGHKIISVDLDLAVARLKTVPIEFYEEAKVLFAK